MNAETRAVALRSTLRFTRSAFLVPHSTSSVHRSSFVVHPFVVLLLLLVAPCALAGTWQRQTTRTLAWLRAVYFVDGERGWAVGSRGTLISTTDGGRKWAAHRAPTEDTLRDVYFVNERAGWLVCERSIYLLKTKEEPRSYLLKTTDGGESWSRVAPTGADTDVLLMRVMFADDLRGWAFGEMGALYTTTDGGANWQRQTVPTKHLLLGGAFLAAGQSWLVGAGSTVLHNPDGAQWRAVGGLPLSRTMRLSAVCFVDEGRGWAVGEDGLVLATTNGGRSWFTQESNARVNLLDVKFIDANEGWAVGTNGSIIHTTDGGAHWLPEPSDTRHTLERISAVPGGRAWAVGFGGTVVTYASDFASPPPQLKTPGAEQPKERPRRVKQNTATH